MASNSSLRISLTAEADGGAPAFVDAQLWAALKAALPALKVSGTYMLSKSSGDMQITAQVNKGEAALSGLTILGQGADYLLKTDLLPDLLLAAPRDTNSLVQLLSTPAEGEWPSHGRLYSAIISADETFAVQLESALTPHMNQINAWLQDYTAVQMHTDAQGQLQLVQTVRIPAEALKAYTKQSLRALYADEALLTLLRQVASQEDAQAYLESGMLPLFESAVDALALSGEMLVVRGYDAAGNLTSEEFDIPFAPGMGIQHIKLTATHGKDKTLTAKATMASGLGIDLTLVQQESMYSGEITLHSAQQTLFAARYTLSLMIGTEVYDEERTNKERSLTHSAVLTLEPMEGQTFPRQQLHAVVELLAGDSSTKPGYCNIMLQWKDLQGDAVFTLRAENKTSAPLRLATQDAGSAVRLENLSVQDLREWLSDTMQSVQKRVSDLFAQCLATD